MKEEVCIARVIAGDTEAYRELVDRYQAGLIIHCENILNDRQDGEDIAQEAFIKAYRNLAGYSRKKAAYSTWLYRIATNLCIDFLRKNKRKVPLDNIEERVEAMTTSYDEVEAIQRIRQAVEQLEPPKYATIIKAYFWEGKSYQQIADEHHTSTNTIGTWIRRAKQQLKEKLV